MSQRKTPFSGLEGQYSTQPEMLAVQQKSQKLFIGIPKEASFQENCVALKPASVPMLCGHGHRAVIETQAGDKSGYTDL